MKKHKSQVHNKGEENESCMRIVPVRIAKYRRNEALCILRNEKSLEESAEWINVDEIEETSLVPVADDDEINDLPLIERLSEWMKSPWSSESS